ncbi:sigma 54-interacting transcriptional regulator [Polyangium sorediatum]|uniref:Sigma 54-interacting transcriptional regulator n=1 Tax=Polyangium sorediatum TaxID=889274 RepID=A0ABT6P9U6_9BACT|nr:sigma-54-dependent Fis family transcriptional regulator [Polyangium sorediatum]MDI1437042.1 sigma 54-interacting transcriptional regulator [Polyangium sorediatum]
MKTTGMRAADLRLSDLFSFGPKGGVMRFAGERVLLFDAVALGLLRKQLIESFGYHAARAVLTRFGYGHGWRTAEALREGIPWADEREWRIAGGRLHRLWGLVTFEPVEPDGRPGPEPFADAIWHDSYEAEQHLLHLGQATEPVCWTLAGFASGYLSRVNGRPIFALEESCRGKGDAVCRMIGRSREEWGEAIVPHLPFYETDCLDASLRHVQRALRRAETRLLRAERLISAGDEETEVPGLVARSEAMRSVVVMARRVARTNATVLLLGESGVGKERIARLVHDASPRVAGPMVAINCAAVPESLLESELFGHAKGAFSGAVTERAGLFEAARGGTLFLDEVGEIPLAMQAKLLRVLEEREVRRVGENRTRPIDVRIVAATHRNLAAAVAQGRFRQDLYFRLRVVEIAIPPLRERPEDILPIARRQLSEAAAREGEAPKELGKSACRALYEHAWPGNVRELVNAMERARILSEGPTIEGIDLPPEIGGAAAATTSREAGFSPRPLAEVERAHILATLAAEGGNRKEAAAKLGIGVATLYRKLKEYAEG